MNDEGLSRTYIDAHCHLADERWFARIDGVIAGSRSAGVGRWIQGGTDPEEWERQWRLANRYPGAVYCVFGLHPWWVAAHSEDECAAAFESLRSEWARSGRAVGLGELGLDAKRAGERGIAHQLRWMEAQLALACELGLPIVLHSVGAGQETLAVLRKVGVPRAGGIVHSFSGSPEQARQYRALGLTLSISAAVTRKGFERLKKAVVELPLEDLVVESDAPDQPPAGLDVGPAIPSPEGYKRVPTESRTPPENRPQAIWRTAEAIAELRNRAAGSGAAPLTAAQVLESSRNRLEKVFRL